MVSQACAHTARPEAVRLARHLADHLGDERPDEVGSIGEVLGHASAGSCCIGEQRERQRVTPTQRREPDLGRVRHPRPLQQVDALGGAERRRSAGPLPPPAIPGSVRHGALGGSRPASTTTIAASSDGRNSLRTQESIGANRS